MSITTPPPHILVPLVINTHRYFALVDNFKPCSSGLNERRTTFNPINLYIVQDLAIFGLDSWFKASMFLF